MSNYFFKPAFDVLDIFRKKYERISLSILTTYVTILGMFKLLFIFALFLTAFPLQILTPPEVKAEDKTNLEVLQKHKGKQKEIEIAADRLVIKLKPGTSLENQPDNKVKTRKEGSGLFNTSSLDKTLNKVGARNAKKAISKFKAETSSVNIFGFKIPTNKDTSDLSRYYTINFNPKSVGIFASSKNVTENTKKFKLSDQSEEFQKYQLLLRMIKANPDVEDVQLSYVYRKIEDTNIATGSAEPSPTVTPSPSASSSPTPSPSSTPTFNSSEATSSAYPDDPYFSSANSWNQGYDDEWDMKKIQADKAWPLIASSSVTIVATSDTGIDYNHEDLKDVVWTDANGKHGFDFVNNDDDPIDDEGHGTHVSGIVGASVNNGSGVVGVSSKVQIMAVKGLDQFGSGFDDQLATGIIWAADHGAKVINMSWGGYGDSPILNQALQYANSLGVTLVAAAGNDDTNVQYFFPANQPNVIAVGASDQNDQKTVFSNWGAKIDLIAPGGGNSSECSSDMCYNILSTKAQSSTFASILDVNTQGTGYMRLAGTSMAAPHVTGAAATVISKNNTLTPTQVRAVLLNSADDVGAIGRDDDSGMGRVNVYRAVTEMNTSPIAHGEVLVPQNLQIIRKTKDIIGTVEQAVNSSFTIEYSKSSQGPWQGSGITLTSGGTGNIIKGKLGTWDTTVVTDGRYYLKLSIKQDNLPTVITNLTEVAISNNLAQGWPALLTGQGQQFGPLINGDLEDNGVDQTLTQLGPELFVLNAKGQISNNWPLALIDYQSYSFFKPAIGELINSNAGKEVVVASTGSKVGDSNVLPKGLYMFDSKGNTLPNWPKSQANGTALNIDQDFQYTPVIADIDLDGKNDIVYPNFNDINTDLLTVFKPDGTALSGFPVKLPGFIISTTNPVLVTKVNGQIRLILFVYDTTLNSTVLVQYDKGGNLVNNKNVGNIFPSNIFMADVNSDNTPEIVWAQTQYPKENTSETFKIIYHAFDFTGAEIADWPKTIDTKIKNTYTCDKYFCYTLSYFINSSTLPSDLDNDGKIDLVTTGTNLYRDNRYQSLSENITLFAMGNNGNQINTLLPENSKSLVTYTKQIIADTNGDGKQEIVYLGKDKYEGQYYLSSIQLDNPAKVILDTLLGTIGQNCANFYSDTMGPSVAYLDNSGRASIITPACKFITDDFMQEKFELQTIKTTGPITKHAWPQYLHDSKHSAQYSLVADPTLGIGLVGSWKMDETSGNKALDSSGNNYAASFVGNVGVGASGRFGKALSFDGKGSLAKADPPRSGRNSITTAGWVNFDTPSNLGNKDAYHDLFGWTADFRLYFRTYTQEPGPGYFLWLQGTTANSYQVHNISSVYNLPKKLTGWHHLAATYDGNQARIYLDGVAVKSQNVIDTGIKNTGGMRSFHIGGDSETKQYFDGAIDEVRLYYRALTGTEINQLFSPL